MLLLILSVILLDVSGPWLAMIGFGAYHGLNPGMGWLFALSLGLQQQNERAIWISLFPIAVGHAASVALVAVLVLAGGQFIPTNTIQLLTAVLLLVFGVYKVFNYYRHPRWVGMKVGKRDLFVWSFLMATAHGAGLMVIPALLGLTTTNGSHHDMSSSHISSHGAGVFLGVGVHILVMFIVMGIVAWLVYKKLGLAVLRKNWINFDLIWAFALLIVGSVALFTAI